MKKNNIYHAVYGDVSGINDATPVLYHGYKVGQVVGTDMLADGSRPYRGHHAINETA